MSDACYLYFKGYDIFPFIFEEEDRSRKMIPVESLEEIRKQINKTLFKKRKGKENAKG